MYGWNSNYGCTLTVQNDSIEFYRDSLPIFADNSISFGRTGTRFSNSEHFYLLMNNSGLFKFYFKAVVLQVVQTRLTRQQLKKWLMR